MPWPAPGTWTSCLSAKGNLGWPVVATSVVELACFGSSGSFSNFKWLATECSDPGAFHAQGNTQSLTMTPEEVELVARRLVAMGAPTDTWGYS